MAGALKMEFLGRRLAVLLFSACILLAHGQENAQTRIPESLIDCYRNQSLRHPENRLPMTINSFIDIVRKVEKYERGTVDMSVLATSMLHRFRLDGIERSQDVQETEGVIPYAVKGNQFYKHRLVLRYLVPANDYQFPNMSLTQVEMCSLHFMLSHSIDKTQRGDESTVCGRLSNYDSGRSSRVPRDVQLGEKTEEEKVAADLGKQSLNIEEEKSDTPDATAEKTAPNVAATTVQGSAEEKSGDVSEQIFDSNQTEERPETSQDDDKSNNIQKKGVEVEIINETVTSQESKSGKFIFDDDIETNNYPQQKARNVLSTTARPPRSTNAERPLSRATISTVESDCPVENGVVRTDWGTVSLGTVLTGIAAGLYTQQIKISDLIQKAMNSKNLPQELLSATIDNKFAATLVGDLAEAALEQGPKKLDDIKVGVTGGWNSTIFPRWYFDNEKEGHELTDAEIRGGLDGLVLGKYVQQWKQSVSGGNLKLSELLSMYYSEDGVFEPMYRACQRRDLYSEVAPNTDMEEQTYRFATVLDMQAISSASVDDVRLRAFAENAVRKLGTYLPAMNDNTCITTLSASSVPTPSPYSNVTIIIDRNWAYKDIRNILFYLMTKLEVGEYGSRITVLDGKNAAPFLTDAIYTTDIDNFTESAYNSHEGGMDIPQILEQELQKSMRDLLTSEKEAKLAGGRSTVVLFIPQQAVSLSDKDLTITREQINHFREYLPDVKFLYLAPGNTENYKELVENPVTDVFTFYYQGSESELPSIIDPVINRIKTVPLRLVNPTCGADWRGENYNTAEFIHSVKLRGVKYHRIHQNYLFGVESAKVTIKGSNSGDLKVCYSRKYEYPVNGTSDIPCQQTSSGNFEIQLDNPCHDYEFITQCPPLYISVMSTGSAQQYSCNHDCVYPSNVEYTITNQGLGCKAGIGRILSNPLLMSLAATLIILLRRLSAGS